MVRATFADLNPLCGRILAHSSLQCCFSSLMLHTVCTVLLRCHHSISGLWPSYYNTSSLLFLQPFGCTFARVLGIIVLLHDPPTHDLTFDWNKAPRFCDSKTNPCHSSYEMCVLVRFGFVCLAVSLDATLQTSWKQLVATLPLNFYGRSKHVLRGHGESLIPYQLISHQSWANEHAGFLGQQSKMPPPPWEWEKTIRLWMRLVKKAANIKVQVSSCVLQQVCVY